MRRLFSLGLIAALLLGSAGLAQAQFTTVLNTLGPVGQPNFTVFSIGGNISNAATDTSGFSIQPQPLPLGGILGNVGYGPNGSGGNPGGVVTGQILTDQTAAANAAISAASTFAGLTTTDSIPGGISGTQTINATGPVTVVSTPSITESAGQTLTLNGPAGTQFVVNVTGGSGITLNNGQIVLTGGLTPSDVVFNVTNNGANVSLAGGKGAQESEIQGIVLAAGLKSQIHDTPGLINGEAIAGGNINIASGGSVVPAPSSLILMGLGGLAFVGLVVVRSRRLPVAS